MNTRYISGFLFMCFFAVQLAAQTFYGTGNVEEFRNGRDAEFRNQTQSPLLEKDFEGFNGLLYFDVDEDFKVNARFVATPDESYFLMPTTSGVSVRYKKVGELNFALGGSNQILYAYQSEKIIENEVWNKKYGHTFFIPFRDSTNGVSTYKGGRYISMKVPDSTEAILDFNLAYNPSCAYGRSDYSCPIPPRPNRLEIPVKAGEKVFAYSKSTRN